MQATMRTQCRTCVMDNSDPNLDVDQNGVCQYCRNFESVIKPSWLSDIRNTSKVEQLAEEIRNAGTGKDFDCIIGLSGGLDSSYVTYVATKIMGLRPLLYHVDAGWNTSQAVSNIEKLVDGLGLDLYTDVVNWEEMKDLQRAFFKSQIPDQDLPQDAAFFSSMYKFARKHKIKHVITGSNYSTECCREPEEWGGYLGIDTTLFRDIHRQFGERKLKTFPLMDILVYKGVYQGLYGMRVSKPLNLVEYIKADAEMLLKKEFGWEPFKHKHHESRFTRFYEDFWLPKKFGFDKRRAHFSSLVMTGQLTRNDAVTRLEHQEMSDEFLKNEFAYVARKLDFSVDEFTQLFSGKNRTYRDYKNKRWVVGLGTKILSQLGIEKRYFK